eukprot:scaffold675_cov103-Cylindrotheca_fusiformis.AAC.27
MTLQQQQQQQQNDYPSSPMLLSSPTSDDVNDGTSSSSNNSNKNQYKILCTTDNVRMQWGSYIIRCQDLKTWSKRCAKDVQIVTLSHEQIHGMLSGKKNKKNKRNPPLELLDHINATVSIKKPFHPPPTSTSKTFRRKNMFGRMFLDVVDNYDITTHNITNNNDDLEIIVQNDYHGQDMFYDRKYHVVEHWYNSFPLDMLSSDDASNDDSSNGIPTTFDLPQIRPISDNDNHNSYLEMATIWTNQLQPCPSFLQQPLRVHYHCIDETYKIETWYQKYFYNHNNNHNNSTLEEQKKQQERLEHILADPNQGPGRLYYELFWRYDVLVIPVKTAFMPKLRYGNVQRAVSQMRSGVPVLLEIYGEVLEDFMDKYNYTCAYVMKNNTNHNQTGMVSSNNNGPKQQQQHQHRRYSSYWTFEEATEAMKSVDLRKQCQTEGLQIVRDYSPNEIAKKQLRALGYQGTFQCDTTSSTTGTTTNHS